MRGFQEESSGATSPDPTVGTVAEPQRGPPTSPNSHTPRGVARKDGDLRGRLTRYAAAYALIGLVGAMVIFFSVWPETSETFPTSANLRALIQTQAVLTVVALAALVPLVCNEFDLSVGANLGMCSMASASLLASGVPVPIAVVAGILLGGVVGLGNGALVTRLGVAGIITTLGTATVLVGIVAGRSGGVGVVAGIPNAFIEFGSGTTLGVPRVLLVMVLVAGGAYFLLAHTVFGRRLYALGSNEQAARLVGINTRRIVLMSFVLAGLLAGCAGVLQVAVAGGANPGVGNNFLLPALTASFLSAAAIKPGQFNVGGTLVAIVFLATLNSGLNLAGAQAYVGDIVNGIALICGVALASFLGRRSA